MKKQSRCPWLALFTALCLLLISVLVAFEPPSALARRSGAANTEDPSQAQYKLGKDREKAGDYDGAIDAFLQAVYFARNNYCPDAQYHLGICYKHKNEDAKAIESFKKYFEQADKPAGQAHIELGLIYMRNNRDEDADREFGAAVATDAGPQANFCEGKLLEKKDDWTGAEGEYRCALGNQPWNYAQAWEALADSLFHQQRLVEAIAEYQAMINHAHSLPDLDLSRVWMGMGKCQVAKGNHQGALVSWQQAIQANPSLPQPHLLLAEMFDKESHISSAINEYRSFLRLAPPGKTSQQAKNRLEWLEQQIKPAEPVMQPVKPSPFMRQQAQQAEQAEQPDRADADTSSGPAPKDSGF